MITSYYDEEWSIVGRADVDPELGSPRVHVRRIKADGVLCIWRLLKLPDSKHPDGRWRIFAFATKPEKGFVRVPESRGQLLSGSRTDLTLQFWADQALSPA